MAWLSTDEMYTVKTAWMWLVAWLLTFTFERPSATKLQTSFVNRDNVRDEVCWQKYEWRCPVITSQSKGSRNRDSSGQNQKEDRRAGYSMSVPCSDFNGKPYKVSPGNIMFAVACPFFWAVLGLAKKLEWKVQEVPINPSAPTNMPYSSHLALVRDICSNYEPMRLRLAFLGQESSLTLLA